MSEPSLQKLRKALLNCSYFHFRSAVYIGWWFEKYLNLNVLAHTNRSHQCKSMYVFLGHEAVCNCLTSTLYGKLNIKRLNVGLLGARSSPLDKHQQYMKEQVLLIKTNRNGCFWFNNCVRLMGLSAGTHSCYSANCIWLMVHFISRHYYKTGGLLKSSEKCSYSLLLWLIL